MTVQLFFHPLGVSLPPSHTRWFLENSKVCFQVLNYSQKESESCDQAAPIRTKQGQASFSYTVQLSWSKKNKQKKTDNSKTLVQSKDKKSIKKNSRTKLFYKYKNLWREFKWLGLNYMSVISGKVSVWRKKTWNGMLDEWRMVVLSARSTFILLQIERCIRSEAVTLKPSGKSLVLQLSETF